VNFLYLKVGDSNSVEPEPALVHVNRIFHLLRVGQNMNSQQQVTVAVQ
jgi:hypothetical protein